MSENQTYSTKITKHISTDKPFECVKKKKNNLTLTLSLLKQQNRQFSSNDQSDTVIGSKSVNTKQMKVVGKKIHLHVL